MPTPDERDAMGLDLPPVISPEVIEAGRRIGEEMRRLGMAHSDEPIFELPQRLADVQPIWE